MTDITRILNAIDQGDPQAAGQLMPLVYEELRKLAAHKLAQENPGQTLQATALVHEAYLRLVGDQQFDNRGHFFAAAAEAMRRILIEKARSRLTAKRGGQMQRVDWNELHLTLDSNPEDILALDEALGQLEKHDLQAGQLVKLRYFSGMSHQEAATVLGLSRRAADRVWALARAWLFQQLNPEK